MCSGTPASFALSDVAHVFYRASNDHISHIWGNNGGVQAGECWTKHSGAPFATSDPVALALNGEAHLFYCAIDGHVHHLWDSGGSAINHDDWSAIASPTPPTGSLRPPPASAGFALTTMAGDNIIHVFYRSDDGAINHLYMDATGAVHFDQWTVRAQAFPAAGSPVCLLTSDGQHVFYAGANGSIGHIWWWDGVFRSENCVTDSATPAAGDPSVVAVDANVYLFYRTATPFLGRLVKSGGAWSVPQDVDYYVASDPIAWASSGGYGVLVMVGLQGASKFSVINFAAGQIAMLDHVIGPVAGRPAWVPLDACMVFFHGEMSIVSGVGWTDWSMRSIESAVPTPWSLILRDYYDK